MQSQTHDRLVSHPRMLGFARLYAAFVPLIVILTFMPLHSRTEEVGGVEIDVPVRGVWQGLMETGHELDSLALTFMVLLVALLIAGAFDVRAAGVPIGIVIGSLILEWMLIARPGFGEDRMPDIGPWGMVGIALGIIGILIAGTHAALLMTARRRK